MALVITVGVLYLVFFVIGNTASYTNPWTITIADRLFWFPVESAFATLGWLIQNPGLVGAATLVLAPVVLILWLLCSVLW